MDVPPAVAEEEEEEVSIAESLAARYNGNVAAFVSDKVSFHASLMQYDDDELDQVIALLSERTFEYVEVLLRALQVVHLGATFEAVMDTLRALPHDAVDLIDVLVDMEQAHAASSAEPVPRELVVRVLGVLGAAYEPLDGALLQRLALLGTDDEAANVFTHVRFVLSEQRLHSLSEAVPSGAEYANRMYALAFDSAREWVRRQLPAPLQGHVWIVRAGWAMYGQQRPCDWHAYVLRRLVPHMLTDAAANEDMLCVLLSHAWLCESVERTEVSLATLTEQLRVLATTPSLGIAQAAAELADVLDAVRMAVPHDTRLDRVVLSRQLAARLCCTERAREHLLTPLCDAAQQCALESGLSTRPGAMAARPRGHVLVRAPYAGTCSGVFMAHDGSVAYTAGDDGVRALPTSPMHAPHIVQHHAASHVVRCGEWVVSAHTDERVRLVHSTAGTEVEWGEHAQHVGSMAAVVSADGERRCVMIGAVDGRVWAYMWMRGAIDAMACVRVHTGRKGVSAVAAGVQDDGRMCAVWGNRFGILYQLQWTHMAAPECEGEPLKVVQSDVVLTLALSPDWRFVVASCADGVVRVIDREAQEVLATQPRADAWGSARFHVCGAGTHAVVQRDAEVLVYRVQLSTAQSDAHHDEDDVLVDVAFARERGSDTATTEHVLVAATAHGVLHMYTAREESDGAVLSLGRECAVDAGVQVRRVATCGSLVAAVTACSGAGSLRMWERGVEDGTATWVLCASYDDVHKRAISCVAVDKWGRTVATAGVDGQLRIWDRTALLASTTPDVQHTAPVHALCFSADAVLLSGGEDGTLRVWEPYSITLSSEHMQCVLTLPVHSGAIVAICMNDDETSVVSVGANGHLVLWDTDFSEMNDPLVTELQQGMVDNATLTSGTWARGGASLMVGTADGRIIEVDVPSLQVVTEMTVGDCVGALASPAASWIAAATWESHTGRCTGPPLLLRTTQLEPFADLGPLPSAAVSQTVPITTPRGTPTGRSRHERIESLEVADPTKAVGIEGWFVKRGGVIRTWRRRYFVLTATSIDYYADAQRKQSKGSIPLAEVQSVRQGHFNEPYPFEIVTTRRVYAVSASSDNARRRWMQAIIHNTAILD